MTNLNSLCITCLSTVEYGANISESLCDFLRNELHFKCRFEERPTKLVCRKCYSTLIEIRRFCLQLRDVELYFECKSKALQIPDVNDLIEEVHDVEGVDEAEEAFAMDFDTTDSVAEQMNDPILIETVPPPVLNVDYHVIESSEPPPDLPQVIDKEIKPKEKRFVCLVCSKLFSSINDLRSHESTHITPNNPKTVPVFLGARKQKACPQCGKRFDLMREFTAHLKNHELDKTKPFRCFKCNRRCVTNEALRDHELMHASKDVQMCQCEICHKQYYNQSSLEAHMRLSHGTDDNATTQVTNTSFEQRI